MIKFRHMETQEPVQEYRMKIVGRRRPCLGGLDAMNNLQRLAIDLRAGKPFVPKGVHTFKSFDEAQEWMDRMLAR
jgi:hypothetical protein